MLCVGVYEGTEADWQLSFDQYLARQNSQIREERYAYLYGSACTNDNALLDRLVSLFKGFLHGLLQLRVAHLKELRNVLKYVGK